MPGKLSILILMLVSSFFACSKKTKELSFDELLQYCKDESNGLNFTKEKGEVVISLLYRPSDFIAQQHLDANPRLDLDSLRENYSRYHYFVLSLKGPLGELSKELTAEQNVVFEQNLAFKFSDFVEVMLDDESIEIADSYYMKSFGTANSNSVLFTIAKKNVEYDKIKVITKDFGINIPDTHFELRYDDVAVVPSLKFNKNG